MVAQRWRRFRNQVERLSLRLSKVRWAFMPLGLCALVAMGVHAAADTLDDRILRLVDALDAGADWAWESLRLSEAWVEAVSAKERLFVARGLTLVWELTADALLAWPALGYAEEGALKGRSPRWVPVDSKQWPALVARIRERPSLLRLARPFAAAACALAGACALARMVQGALYLSLRRGLWDGVSAAFARWTALAALVVLVGSFGWRVLVRSLQHADELAEGEGKATRPKVWMGWAGAVVVVPLGIAAVVDASPVLSFFK